MPKKMDRESVVFCLSSGFGWAVVGLGAGLAVVGFGVGQMPLLVQLFSADGELLQQHRRD